MQAMALVFFFLAQAGNSVETLKGDKAEISVLSKEVFRAISDQNVADLREMSAPRVGYGPTCSDFISKTSTASKTFEKLIADVRHEAASLKEENKIFFWMLSSRSGYAQVGDREDRWRLEFRKARDGRWKFAGIYLRSLFQGKQVKKRLPKNTVTPPGPTKLASVDTEDGSALATTAEENSEPEEDPHQRTLFIIYRVVKKHDFFYNGFIH